MGQFSDLFDEGKPQPPSPAIAVQLTADAVPQQEARYKDLATRYKVPVDLVRTFPKDYEVKAKVDDIDKATANVPHLRSWLADTKNAALVDAEDVSTLGSIGNMFAGRTFKGTAQDVGVTAAKGVVGLSQAVVGLADIPTFGYVGKLVEAAGVNMKDAQTILDLMYSPAQTDANLAVKNAKGFTGTLGAALSHPSTIVNAVGESVPQMLGGAAIARKVINALPAVAAWAAAATGEGILGAGGAAENLRSNNADGLLTLKQNFASVMSGVGTAAFGAAGGKAAQKLGIADLDTMLVKGGVDAASATALKGGFISSLAKAGLSEGVFEELPQSMQEQAWQNFATDRPIGEGVLEAGAMGLLAGAAGGAGAQVIGHHLAKASNETNSQQIQQQQTEQSVQHLTNLLGLAAQSKLRERSPQTFAEVSQEMAENTEGAPTEVRFDARTLGEVLNQDELTLLPSIASQMEEALATGGEVSVPIGELMANVAGTPLEQKLTEHARVGDNELSAFEAKEAQTQAETYLQDEAKRVITEATDSIGTQASADKVKQTMLDQFTELGRFTPDVNGAYATMASHMYTALGARLGVTPEQAYAAHPLTLNGVNPATQGEVLNTVDQSAFEHLADEDTPRGERIAAFIKDATEFAAANGVRAEFNTDMHNPIGHPDTPKAIELTDLYADTPGSGGGTKVMERIAQMADALGITVHARPEAPRNLEFYARFGFNKTERDGTLTRYPAMLDDGYDQSAKVKLPKKAKTDTAVEIRKGPALRGEPAMSIGDIAAYFDKITGKRDFNDPKEQKRALKTLVTELQFQIQQEKSGLDWYDADTKAAFENTQEFIPELAHEQKRQLFSIFVGLQSPGTNARDNWVIAAEAFKHFGETGVVPARNPATGGLWQGGVTSATKEKTLNFLNNMVQELGETAATDWLMSEHSVRELNEARANWGGMSAAVQGKADDQLMGLFVFGPKLAPFIMNINGLHELTIDVWASRSFGRLFGQMLNADGKIIEAPTEPQRRVMKELLNDAAEQLNIKPYQAQALLWFFEQQLANQLGSGSASWGFSDGARRYADRARNARDQGVLFQTGDSSGSTPSTGLTPLEGAPAHGPDPQLVSIAEQYALDNGIPLQRQAEYVKVDPAFAKRIADAYEAMPHDPQNPEVAVAYADLIAQTRAQYDALEKAGYKFTFFDSNTDPYAGNPMNAMRDLRATKSMAVYGTYDGFGSSDLDVSANPLLAPTGLQWPDQNGEMHDVLANDMFRAVHDAFGHGLEGAFFRAQGEENAWQAHSRMFTGPAVGAMTTETRGQNSWLNYGPHGEKNRTAKLEDTIFADQKTGLMPSWTWEEGRAGDMPRDIQEQIEQRKLRQAVDLLVLQKEDTLDQKSEGTGAVNLTGVHFSKESRASLDGRYYGSGLKGAERDRVFNAQDGRLTSRLYFYVDEGKGVRSEAGVGGNAHESQLTNVYDIKADPLKLVVSGNLNQSESNILDAGFNGYYVSDAFNGQGAAVLIGAASHGIATTPISNPNQPLPSTQAVQPYKRGLSSQELSTLNLDEVQKVAPSAQVRAGTFQVAPQELAAAQQAMAAQGIPLPLPNTLNSSTARGTFNPKTMTISLLEGADLSTFHHEMAHFYLEVLANIASQDNAPAAVASDMALLLKMWKVKDLDTWNKMTLAQKRDHHEKFAEGFEHYLFEGKAPSVELQPLFQRFASWMKNVYKSLTDFMASHNTQLSPEVRGVYDRMLATDAQIAEAEQARKFAPLFKSAEEIGMGPTEWAQYQMAADAATESAMENLNKRSLRDLKWAVSAKNKAVKDATKDVEAKRKAVEAEVRAEVEAMPVYAAKTALDKITNPTDADLQLTSEWFNYPSPDAMMQDLADAQPIKHVIEGVTDQRLLERYGDLTTPQGIERAANEAVHNEARAKFVATELKALQEGVRIKTTDRTTILEKLKECLAT